MNSSIEKGERGERAFANLCNKWKCEYLHIRQDKDGLSSEMFLNYEKRPDFFVNIPDIAPIFVEVKVKPIGRKKESGPLSKEPAFGEEHAPFLRTKNFQSKVGIATWYAFIENTGKGLDETIAYLSPVSRLEKQIHPNRLGDFKGWPIIWTPRKCMNRCADHLDLSNLCIKCIDRICESPDI